MLLTLFVFIYMEVWPVYIRLFFESILLNPNIHFIIITNLNHNHTNININTIWNYNNRNGTNDNSSIDIDYIPSNVEFKYLSTFEFNCLLNEHIHTYLYYNIDITHEYKYKYCDFRPMLIDIFPVKDTLYWGWSDIDVILGDIESYIYYPNSIPINKINYTDNTSIHGNTNTNSNVITPIYDVIHHEHGMLTNGPLTILKNTKIINKLYMNFDNITFHHSLVKDIEHIYGNDEVLMNKYMKNMNKNKNNKNRNQFNQLNIKPLSKHKFDCTSNTIVMYYNGQLYTKYGTCVLYHYGGNGQKMSIPDRTWCFTVLYNEFSFKITIWIYNI